MISRISNFSGALSNFFNPTNQNNLSLFGSYNFDSISESYLTTTDNSYIIGTQSFTLEAWFNTRGTGYRGIVSARNLSAQRGISINISPGNPSNLEFYVGESSMANLAEYQISIDTWYHAAISRDGNTTRYFINGTKVNEFTDNNNYQNIDISVGKYYNDYVGYFWEGLITDINLNIGNSLYNTNFTPSIQSIIPSANTKFLLRADKFNLIYNDGGVNPISDYGAITFRSSRPSNIIGSQSSISMNGTTDWLELSPSADFALTNTYTIEFWSKAATNSIGSIFTIISQIDSDSAIDVYYQSGNLSIRNGVNLSTEPTPGIWTHVAIVSDSGNVKLFYNGVDQLITANGGNLQNTTDGLAIGRRGPTYDFQYFNGSLYGIRLVKGIAVYSSDFDPYDVSLPPSLTDDTSLLVNKFVNNEFVDSTYKRTIIKHGPSYNSDIPIQIGGSLEFGQGTERYLSLSGSSDWAVGTGDFCVEWFQYQTSSGPPNYPRVFSVGSYPNESIGVSIESGFFLGWLNGGTTFYGGFGLGSYLNQWIHFAYVRESGLLSIYRDGQKIWGDSVNNNVSNSTEPLYIGFGTNNYWSGYLTNFRFVKGNSVYSGTTFSVPTQPLTAVTGTKLLLNVFNAYLYDFDSSEFNKSIINVNGVTWSSMTPFT